MLNYPNRNNPIILSPNNPEQSRQILSEFSHRITNGELKAQRQNKTDKIPALPFRWPSGITYHSWCFVCFAFIGEALRHYYIKNRHDARFWGLPEKKALCSKCLAKRLAEMSPRKRYLWKEYQKRGYWWLQ